jgi:hypothetical protein
VRVFVSYANEQRDVADRLAVGLRQAGAEAFFDRDALPAGAGYDARLREEIARADVLVFLLSPQSLERGTYALTELGLARERWPDPSGHVLPVAVATLPDERAIPPYLAAVGILRPEGNVVAEVLAAIERLRPRRRWARVAGALGVLAALALAAYVLIPRPPPEPAPPCSLSARVVPAGSSRGRGLVKLDVSTSQGTESFVLNDAGAASLQAAVVAGQTWSIDVVDSRGVALGTARITGCPAAAFEVPIADDVALALHPR